MYKGRTRLSRESILEGREEFIRHIEALIFKSKHHMKRGIGIRSISKRLVEINITNRENHIDFKTFVTSLSHLL